MSTDVSLLESFVELVVSRHHDYMAMSPASLYEVCVGMAALVIPVPADIGTLCTPDEFIELAFTVGSGAFRSLWQKIRYTRSISIDESIVDLVQLTNQYSDWVEWEMIPAKLPRSATFVAEVQWISSPHHLIWCRWYVSMSTTRQEWVLWDFTPDWKDWGFERPDYALAMIPSKGIDRRTAAMHMLVALLRSRFDDEAFTMLESCGILTEEEISEVSDVVWGLYGQGRARPLENSVSVKQAIEEAWRWRVWPLIW